MDKAFIKAKVESLGKSELMVGRTPIAPKDLCNMYPEGLSLCKVDMVDDIDPITFKKRVYAVAHFSELPSHYVRGGFKLNQLVALLIDGYGKDEANAELERDPIHMRLVSVETSNGNIMVDYIID